MQSEYPYLFRWDREGRKGQRCRAEIGSALRTKIVVQFEDGKKMLASRYAIVRVEDRREEYDEVER